MGTPLTGALNASGRKKLQFPTDISLLAHKRSKIDGYMRLTSIESSFHPCNTLTAIVPGAYSLRAGAPEQPKNRSLVT